MLTFFIVILIDTNFLHCHAERSEASRVIKLHLNYQNDLCLSMTNKTNRQNE